MKINWSKGCLDFSTKTYIMGILNVTPDSFSDGGQWMSTERAIAQGLSMAQQGADIIDIGGESTRPGSEPIAADEEIARIVPIIEALSTRVQIPISVDTCKAIVAEAALSAGAAIINDVTGLHGDPRMLEIAVRSQVPVVIMHLKGTPKTMQIAPHYDDVVGEILQYFDAAVKNATKGGLAKELIILDPGIGFGKTLQHNLEILARLKEFAATGAPILVGASRKSFIGALLDLPPSERDIGTAASTVVAIMNGASIVRVHNVSMTKQIATIVDAIGRLSHN